MFLWYFQNLNIIFTETSFIDKLSFNFLFEICVCVYNV